MAEEVITNTNVEKTTSSVQYTTVSTPLFDVVKDRLPTVLSIIFVLGSLYFAVFRLDALEKKVLAQEIEVKQSVLDQQSFREEVRIRLSVIETKQDITNNDIQKVLDILGKEDNR